MIRLWSEGYNTNGKRDKDHASIYTSSVTTAYIESLTESWDFNIPSSFVQDFLNLQIK